MRAKILGLLTAIVIVTSACMSSGEGEAQAEQIHEVIEIEILPISTPRPTPFPDFDLEHLAICGRDENANEETGTEEKDPGMEEKAQDPEPAEENQQEETGRAVESSEGSEQSVFEDCEAIERMGEDCEENTDQRSVYLGEYMITFYCPCEICCGEWATGCTASGVPATANHTIACDLPFGTVVEIEGLGIYVVEDRGVSGAQIDVFVEDHQEALNLGEQYRNVYILED